MSNFNPSTPATPSAYSGAPPTPGPVYDQPPSTPGPVYGGSSYTYAAPSTPNPTYQSNSFRAPGSNQGQNSVAVKQMRPPETPAMDCPPTPRSAADHGVGPPTLQNIGKNITLECQPAEI